MGAGAFRTCYVGLYDGGFRHMQQAAIKRFKPQFGDLEREYFSQDFGVEAKALQLADRWNSVPGNLRINFLPVDRTSSKNGKPYVVEPFLDPERYIKFTSNTGWIGDAEDVGFRVRALEAFSHFCYHVTMGDMIVCDFQGRYRANKGGTRRGFQLLDPAVCTRWGTFGPTDMGQKGIATFFANHTCNEYCSPSWDRPATAQQWLPPSPRTQMLPHALSHALEIGSQETLELSADGVLQCTDAEPGSAGDAYPG